MIKSIDGDVFIEGSKREVFGDIGVAIIGTANYLEIDVFNLIAYLQEALLSAKKELGDDFGAEAVDDDADLC